MNIGDHFICAEVSLDLAKEKVSREDYFGAQTCLGEAYWHTRELLDYVSKLAVLKADIEVETEDGH